MKHLNENQMMGLMDKTLGADEARQARAHVESCPDCRAAYEGQVLASRGLHGAVPEVPRDRMWLAISARLDNGAVDQPEARPGLLASLRQWFSAPMPRYGAVVAAMLALGLTVMLFRAPKTGVEEARPAAAAQAKAPAQPAKPQALAAAKPSVEGQAKLRTRDLSTPRAVVREAGTGGRAYLASASAVDREAEAPAVTALPAARGGRGTQGGFAWEMFEAAMSRRDYRQAAAELKAAPQFADSAAERAVAATAVHLLTQPDQPMYAFPFEPQAEAWSQPAVKMVVLQAMLWGLTSSTRQARYQGSVMARVAGLRSQGAEMLLDWGRQVAVFGNGSTFVRTAGEAKASVVDAKGKPVADNEIRAASGAWYDFKDGVLHLL